MAVLRIKCDGVSKREEIELADGEFTALSACGCSLLISRLGNARACGCVLLVDTELEIETYTSERKRRKYNVLSLRYEVNEFDLSTRQVRHAVAQLLEGRGFDSRWCH